MAEQIKQRLLKGWRPMRWIALGLGLFLGIQTWLGNNIFSAFFLFQAVTNSGCWGSTGCRVPKQNSSASTNVKDITYTEINE